MKQCRTCMLEKDENNFRPKRKVCNDCERTYGREYRNKNPDKSKKWTEENKKRMQELQSKWYKSNKDYINTKFRERYHDVDSDFKKVKNYRTGINHMLAGKQKTNKYIGCNMDHLNDWCEYNFEDGMLRETYGKSWVIDLVIPLDFANIYGFTTLAKWYNVCPVKDIYNLKKNKYIDTFQLMTHMENIRSYCDYRNVKLDQEYMEILAKHLDAGNPLEP